jgi:signal peptidase I
MTELILGSQVPAEKSTPGTRILIKVLICLGAAFAISAFILILMFFHWTKSLALRAFRVPSNSMCPAICSDERVIAGMDVFDQRPPQRGEVILCYHKPSAETFIKRIVAVGGDVVSPGPGNSVLVNGKAVEFPVVCGDPARSNYDSEQLMPFQAVTVPTNSFFVIGDNLSRSLDSRIPDFGLVRSDQVRGKPLFIYWSPGKSRFGCPVR